MPTKPTAALLASQSDGAILVIRHGKTTREQLAASVERLENVGARALGVVLNMVPPLLMNKGSYGYGYGYGYGYAPEAGRRKAAPEPRGIGSKETPPPASDSDVSDTDRPRTDEDDRRSDEGEEPRSA